MATLQKFKHLATQCAVAGSPTRSPTASPLIHLRRRKSLRMLLSRYAGGRRPQRRQDSTDRLGSTGDPAEGRKALVISHKLKDLFVSSPPFEDRNPEKKVRDKGEALVPANCSAGGCSGAAGGSAGRRAAPRTLRPLSATFRQRLLRRAWRPVLVPIPEH